MDGKSPGYTSMNDRMESPGFLLRPPLAPEPAPPTRHPSQASARLAETATSPAVKSRAHLDAYIALTPTKKFTPPGEPLCNPSSCAASAHPGSGLPPRSRPTSQNTGAQHACDQEFRWPALAGSQAGALGTYGSGASSSGGGHNSNASPGGASGPIFASGYRAHDSFHSMNKPGRMPDYLKVYTVPKDVQYEEEVIIEPIIQSLGIGDKQMEQRISDQMTNLYDFFKQLYEQDQDEIRTLQAQVAQRDMQLRQLRRTNQTPTKDHHQQRAGFITSLASPAKYRQRLESIDGATCQAKKAVSLTAPPPAVTLLLPPLLNPARPFYKWWANVHNHYRRHSTLWLGIVFALVLIIATALLAGLLHGMSQPGAIATPAYMPYTPPGPAVNAIWPVGLSFTVNMSAGASAFYALVPAVTLLAANQTPSAADVRALIQGPALSPLSGLAVACGERVAMQAQPLTFAVAAAGAPEVSAVGMTACEVAGALPGRCGLCPDVRPATSYALLVAFADSEDIFQLPVTTSPQPASNATVNSPSPPPQPSPLPASPFSSPSPPPPSPSPPPPSAAPTPATTSAPNFTTAPVAAATGQASLNITLSLSSPGLVRYLVMYSVLYGQADDVYVSYDSPAPAPGQLLVMAPAPSAAVLGVGGVVAGGMVNVTQAGVPYTIRVDGNAGAAGGGSSSSSGTAAVCACGAGACFCTAPAPCQGAMCNVGPSALSPNTAYKVFVSASTPDGINATTGPTFAGTVTTAADTSGPSLAPGAVMANGSISAGGFSLTGLQLDTAGTAYVMVSTPLVDTQVVAAGFSTAFTEQSTSRRRLQGLGRLHPQGRQAQRSLLQSTLGTLVGSDAGGDLVTLDAAPAAAVFTPPCPRVIACNTSKVITAYFDAATEALAAPVRCLVLASARAAAATQAVVGLANDTAYVVRVITEDTARNQRVYAASLRTVDLRPPVITAVAVRPAFTSINLTVTLSEPGAVAGFLYTVAGAANASLAASPSWPPSPQGPVIQQVTASTSTAGTSASVPSGVATCTLSFNDPSITPKTNYTVALVARDLPGNVQPTVTLVSVRTEDNIAPQWLAVTVAPGAFDANMTVALDEPSTAFWFCLSGNVSCPSAATLFQVFDNATAPTPSGLVARGSIAVNNSSPVAATVSGLGDGMSYTLCLVAEDASPLRNRQATAKRLGFVTQDRTPPTLAVAVVPGSDGNFTCDRSTYLCRLTLNVTLSEAGSAVLALQYADMSLINFTATNLSALNLTSPPSSVLRASSLRFNASSWQQLQLSSLASGRGYRLALAATDIAGNLQQRAATLALLAPDVTPPAFTNYAALSTADTVITVNVSLNEPCTVMWTVLAAGSPAPNASQVVTAANSGQPLTGSLSYPSVSASPLTWNISGSLAAGRSFDIFMFARDVSGNQQTAVTTIQGVRCQDSTPPVILNLTVAVEATGNRFTLTVKSTKPGSLHYLAVRAGAPVPTRQQILQVSTYPAASANFSGQLAVPSALVAASATLCVADGTSYQVWAVQEDLEGQFPNRQPNYSNVTRAAQVLKPNNNSATCSPESRMRAMLLDASLAAGSFGWPMGRLAMEVPTSSNVSASWIRDYWLVGGAGGGVGSSGTVVASIEGLQHGSLSFLPTRPSPTQIRVVLQTPSLFLDTSALAASPLADPGATLRFAYQLMDASLRTTVNTDGLRLVPSFTATPATPSGRWVLPACSLAASAAAGAAVGSSPAGNGSSGGSPPSSIGVCGVQVPAQAFPVSGNAAAALLQVDVYNGTLLLANSAATSISLRAAASLSPSVSANGTAVLLALPARPLHAGESFRVSLSAAVGTSQAMTGFSIQLSYNASRLAFLRAEQSGLWSDLVAVPLPAVGGATADTQLWLTALTRTAPNTMYQGRGVPLLDAYFQLVANDSATTAAAAAVAPNGITLAVLGVSSSSMLYPYSASPTVLIQDYRTASNASTVTSGSGSVVLVAPLQLALIAYLSNHDLFNSAVLNGNDVVAPIQTVLVSDWAANNVTITAVDAAASCTCSLPNTQSGALAVHNCRVTLSAAHRQPSKQANVTVACGGGGGTTLQAQTSVTVWYPSAFRAEAADPDATLSSLLPVNVPAPAQGSCLDRYQSTQMVLLANWTNGGSSSSGDYLTGVDVTPLVAAWTADDPQALRITGSTVTGMAPNSGVNVSAVGANGSALATARLAVSDQPVCVEAVEAVAVSAVAVAGEGQPTSPGRWRVRFTPQQALNWELASATVSVFAALSDGAVMAVSNAATITAIQPSVATTITNTSNSSNVTNATTTLLPLPFSLQPLAGASPLSLLVNASLGASTAYCGAYLQTSWRVCSSGGTASAAGSGLPIASGYGTVRVALPTPTIIAALLISAPAIASPDSGAALPPISVPTRAAVRVLVGFDDGQQRDMTTDARVEVWVSQGADLCSLMQDANTSEPYVQATGSPYVGGTCGLQARASFAGLAPLAAANATTVITLTSLQVYVVDGSPASPPASNSSSLTGLASPALPLRLFKCDFSHYVPASVWVMGKLSNCGSSCSLLDLNDPAHTTLHLSDTSAVSLATNPVNTSLPNLLLPSRPGSSVLNVSFGAAAPTTSSSTSVSPSAAVLSVVFNVSVENTFQPGWPRVTNITDNGFTVAANMTSAAFRVTYLVKAVAAAAAPGGATVPTAADVERDGVALSLASGSGGGPFLLSDSLSGLAPATNYSVFLAVRFQSQLISTVVAITGALTPDHVAPTFAAVGMLQNLTTDTQRFTLRLPVSLSEAGTVSYAIYRNSTCISGRAQVSIGTILAASSLPATSCGCTDATACQPVAWGNVSLSSEQPNDTITISGLLPPNPYSVLNGAPQDQLTCRSASLPAPASAEHLLYLVAQDDLPTFRGWNVTCNPPAASPGDVCAAAAAAPCSAKAPANSSAGGGNNVQTLPYYVAQLNQTATVFGAPAAPMLASFSLPIGARVVFDATATSITASSRTITFVFRVNKICAVQYRLDQFNGTSVFSGVYPVFDPQVSYTVAISKTCGGDLLVEPSYTLWYWATDVYGRSSAALSASVVL